MKIVALLKLNLIIVTILILAGVASMVLMYSFIDQEQTTTRNQATFKQLGADLMASSNDLTSWARCYTQYGDEKYYNLYMSELNQTRRRQMVVDGLRELNAPDEEQRLVQKALALSNILAELEIRAFELVKANNFDAARALLFSKEYEEGKQPIIDTMKTFEGIMNARAEAEADAASLHVTRMFIGMSLLFSVIFVAIILSIIIISIKIKPIKKLVSITGDIAEGDFTTKVDFAGKDEFGHLGEHFSYFIDNVSRVLRRSKSSAADTMQSNAVMAGTINELSQNFQNQADQISGIAATMEEMHTSSARIKQNVLSAMQDVSGVLTLADNGAVRVNEIHKHMGEISERTTVLSYTIQQLEQASKQVGDILNVINSVADQTNLLAVNAAIEAARAGKTGKGFGIVADEVRKLAERTQRETATIIAIMHSLQESSATAAKEMHEVEASIKSGATVIESTQDSFINIASSTQKTKSNVNHVEHSITEQADALANINNLIQTIAAGIEESTTSIAEVRNHSKLVQKQASEAHAELEFFRV